MLRRFVDGGGRLIDTAPTYSSAEDVLGELLAAGNHRERIFLATKLSGVLGKEAIPHFRVKPEIIGGLVVRTGTSIYDGSVRRRLEGMRRQLLRADI